jgi:hypothetical protein
VSRYLVIVLLIISSGCLSHRGFFLPVVEDERLQAFVREESTILLRVSENAHRIPSYSIQLAKFPRQDILGLSVGQHRIFISYELARRAYEEQANLWLLRQTLAHEIAHDVLGHEKVESQGNLNLAGLPRGLVATDLGLSRLVSFRNYSAAYELAADHKAMEYWRKKGWDCRIWIDIFENFLEQNYYGDPEHPTEERLRQAKSLCNSADP